MKCFFCKGSMVESTTNYMADLDGHFIIIRNVPCHKCTQCGEVTYSGTVAARLDELVTALEKMMAEVAIIDYEAA